jgi:hypothetical protein
MTGLSVAITVDSSLTIGTPSGIGWTCNTAGHVITCTRVHGWIGAQPTITIPVTTGSSALTASTSVAVTGSNFSTANATQTTVVGLVASDNGRYFPQSTAQWNTLIARRGLVNWVAPDMLHLMQEASGNLADSTGSFTLTASGTGLAYQQTVSGFTTKAVTTTDAGTGAFSTTSASLPDLSATSFLYLAYLMETATPATSRSLVTMGTTRVAAEVGNNNFVTCIGGVNSAGGVGNIQNTLQPQIVLHDKTNSRQGEYNNTDSAEPTFGSTATGKKLAVGAAARSSATCSYMFGAGWTGAHAERSRQDIHDMQIALGFPASWTP